MSAHTQNHIILAKEYILREGSIMNNKNNQFLFSSEVKKGLFGKKVITKFLLDTNLLWVKGYELPCKRFLSNPKDFSPEFIELCERHSPFRFSFADKHKDELNNFSAIFEKKLEEFKKEGSFEFNSQSQT